MNSLGTGRAPCPLGALEKIGLSFVRNAEHGLLAPEANRKEGNVGMFSAKVTLMNPQSFNIRPASMLVAEVSKYNAAITLVAGDKEIPANSLMAIMAAGIPGGTELEVRAVGTQETEAGRAIVEFIANDMGDVSLS